MNRFLHAHALPPSVHTLRVHPSTPRRVPGSCVADLYDKVADRQWQGCDPALLTADVDSVIALPLHVCVFVCVCMCTFGHI